MKRTVFVILASVVVLLLAGQVLAMDSTNYRLDWFTPLSSNAAGAASSTNYAMQFTVGQSAYQTSSSTNYGACWGYWCGSDSAAAAYRIYLPLVLRAVS